MNLAGIDLNLMLALDALLREVSVTRAAERLNLTQPTLSQSLARLRKHFDDDLLRRNGQDMELTPLGVRLRPMVAEALVSAQGVFEAHRAFDPATSTRRFVVAASDYGIGVVGARWSAHVGRRAPSVRIAFRTVAATELSPWEVRSRDVDGILAPHGLFPEEMPHLDVVVDRWVIVADEKNRALSSAPTMEQLGKVPWVTNFETTFVPPPQSQRGQWAGLSSRIAVVVENFSEIPLCVRHTPRVALIQERLFHALDAREGLRVLPPPVPMDPIVLAFWWHPSFGSNQEHLWLRSQFESFRDPRPLTT